MGPYSYKKTDSSGKFLFVMLAPGHPGHYLPASGLFVVERYPSSGLYRNDGTITPLWTVDWWTAKDSVFVSSDGEHLARVQTDPGPEIDEAALVFYERGKELKRYTMRDLVSNPELYWVSDLPSLGPHLMRSVNG